MPSSSLLVLLTILLTPQAQAHTWADQINLIAPNGTFIGDPGYPRGYVPRKAGLDPTGSDNVYQLPPDGRTNAYLPTDLICKSTQSPGSYASDFPPLAAYPGAHIAIRYQENGHVTQPWLTAKGIGGGVVYVYGTTESHASHAYLDVHKVWTPTSSPGRLLATQYFDDGRCYEANTASNISNARASEFPHNAVSPMGPKLWCQTDVTLPTDIDASTYTLYWVWDWPTIDGEGNVLTNQSYTSCIDVNIVDAPAGTNVKTKASFIPGQDLNFAAVQHQLETQLAVDPMAKQTLNTGWMKGAVQTTSVYQPNSVATPIPPFRNTTISASAASTPVSISACPSPTAAPSNGTRTRHRPLLPVSIGNSVPPASSSSSLSSQFKTTAASVVTHTNSTNVSTAPFTLTSVRPFLLGGDEGSATLTHSAGTALSATTQNVTEDDTKTIFITVTVTGTPSTPAPTMTNVGRRSEDRVLRIRGRSIL